MAVLVIGGASSAGGSQDRRPGNNADESFTRPAGVGDCPRFSRPIIALSIEGVNSSAISLGTDICPNSSKEYWRGIAERSIIRPVTSFNHGDPSRLITVS